MSDPALPQMEEALRRLVRSLDKAIQLEALTEGEKGWVAILSKGTHADRANLSREQMEGLLQGGKGEKELRHALGKVIGKLNRMAQKRR